MSSHKQIWHIQDIGHISDLFFDGFSRNRVGIAKTRMNSTKRYGVVVDRTEVQIEIANKISKCCTVNNKKPKGPLNTNHSISSQFWINLRKVKG